MTKPRENKHNRVCHQIGRFARLAFFPNADERGIASRSFFTLRCLLP